METQFRSAAQFDPFAQIEYWWFATMQVWQALPFFLHWFLFACFAIVGWHFVKWCLSSLTNTLALSVFAFGLGFFLVEHGVL